MSNNNRQNQNQQRQSETPRTEQKPQAKYDPLLDIFKAIADEIESSNEKHGDQTGIKFRGGSADEANRLWHENHADTWKRNNDIRSKAEAIGWDGILLEEVHEAFAEDEVGPQIAELIQVAAVAVKAIQALEAQRA